ncbi:MAG: bifunctional adenosylcobinamide kinase/adenosylcobinamide-phosphate guanylyltransferase [Fretibacterium sp.]|nr:bifunctional adenosylcobinamide kinase/adenosylcobinamide-phosphate guanylyltransferase [Fretibacterium sp.]
MHLILGGRYMGKLAWAESLYGPFRTICDLACEAPEGIEGAMAVLNLQAGVRTLLSRDEDVQKFFDTRLSSLRDSVLIGDEVGEGIVPLDTFERRWRDEVGLLYQMLAREADMVDRVWAGLAIRLKG